MTNKPLLHEPHCEIVTSASTPREWLAGDENFCTCDLRDRIRDARATDTKTGDLFGSEQAEPDDAQP